VRRGAVALPELPSEYAALYRVVVVDDRLVVRRGLRAMLDTQHDMEGHGEASNGTEAVELVKKGET